MPPQVNLAALHDPSHREWDDARGALKAAGLYWVIPLTTCSFNLAFGPWAQAAFFGELQGAAAELFAKSVVHGPLCQSFYPALCRGEGEQPLGTLEHTSAVLALGPKHEAYALKGPRVALCRWPNWVGAVGWHGRVWNWRLLAIVAM